MDYSSLLGRMTTEFTLCDTPLSGRQSTANNHDHLYLRRPSLPERNFTVADFCQRVTSHGLVDWYEAKSSVAKGWWSFLILLSVVVLLYQIGAEIYEYYTGAIQTTVSFVPKLAMEFPQIYVCPLSFVNKYCVQNWTEYREQIGIYKRNSGSILDQTGSSWQILAPYIAPRTRTNVYAPILQGVARVSLPQEIICGPENQGYLKYVAMAVPDFFVQCKFNGQNVSCDCIAKAYLDKEFGVCYLIDVSNVSGGFQTTENVGLSLMLDTHRNYFPNRDDLKNPNSLQFAGVQIRAEKPVDPSSFGGTLVRAGTYTRMILSAEEINLIDIGYSTTPQHCVSEGKNTMKYFNATYSVELCRMDCTQMFLKETCNCVMPFDPKFILEHQKDIKICAERDFDICVKPKVQAPGAVKTKLDTCTEACYDTCHSWEYGITISDLVIPESENINERSYVDLVESTCDNSTSSMTLVCHKDPDMLQVEFIPPDVVLNFTNEVTTIATDQTNGASNQSDVPGTLNQRSVRQTDDSNSNDTTLLPTSTETISSGANLENGSLTPAIDDSASSSCPFSRLSENPLDARTMDKELIILEIAFNKLQYTQIQQSPPRTITTLFSNIGGQAGLWTGASIFTIVQVMVFATYLMYSKIGGRMQSKN